MTPPFLSYLLLYFLICSPDYVCNRRQLASRQPARRGSRTQAGRPAGDVTLLAVSKTFPAAAVQAAFDAGQRAFGENYVQEGVDKIAQLGDLRDQISWHFIGPLQSNKTRAVAEQFDWVHAIDRLRIAERLSAQRPAGMAPLQVCLQVDISGEASKSGIAPDEVPALARAVAALPGLRLRGLTGANDELLLAATAMNLRKMATLIWKPPKGDRRSVPA